MHACFAQFTYSNLLLHAHTHIRACMSMCCFSYMRASMLSSNVHTRLHLRRCPRTHTYSQLHMKPLIHTHTHTHMLMLIHKFIKPLHIHTTHTHTHTHKNTRIHMLTLIHKFIKPLHTNTHTHMQLSDQDEAIKRLDCMYESASKSPRQRQTACGPCCSSCNGLVAEWAQWW